MQAGEQPGGEAPGAAANQRPSPAAGTGLSSVARGARVGHRRRPAAWLQRRPVNHALVWQRWEEPANRASRRAQEAPAQRHLSPTSSPVHIHSTT